MKTLRIYLLVFLGLGSFPYLNAQNEACAHCNMYIVDDAFRAKATTDSGKTLHFDAIECLVNHLNKKEGRSFRSLQVTNYLTRQFIDAANAHYLESQIGRASCRERVYAPV